MTRITRSFAHDAFAALVLTTLLIPAGMGYAELAGLPAVTGLWASIVPMAVYAAIGPSPVLIVGPDSSVAPIIAVALAPLAMGDPDRAVALAGLLAVLTGVILLAGGLLRLGFTMDLLSKPIRLGYLNGVALTVIVIQLPKLMGFSSVDGDLVDRLRSWLDGIAEGRASSTATAIGVIALGGIIVLRRFAPRVPGMLLAVVGGAAAVIWFDLEVPVVGSLPRGLPEPALGSIGWGDVTALLPAAAGIALVAFADTGVLSRALAARHGREPRANREMAALGATNVAAGVLGGFAVSGSSSRTPVAIESGARTRLAGALAAAMVAVVLLAAPTATRHLPSAALAAVVVAAALALADVPGMVQLWRARTSEFILALAAFAGVATLGVLRGIAVAVGLSLVDFVAQAWRPHMAELGRMDRRKGYHDLARHPEGRRIPGLVIVRFDAPLFFANAAAFSAFVRRLLDSQPDPVRWVVVAAEPVTDIDTTAAEVLCALDDELTRRNVHLAFAGLKGPVKDRLAAYGLDQRFGAARYYPTLGTAVSAYVTATGTHWVDWEDLEMIPDGTPSR